MVCKRFQYVAMENIIIFPGLLPLPTFSSGSSLAYFCCFCTEPVSHPPPECHLEVPAEVVVVAAVVSTGDRLRHLDSDLIRILMIVYGFFAKNFVIFREKFVILACHRTSYGPSTSGTAGGGAGFWTGMGAGGLLGYLFGNRGKYENFFTDYYQEYFKTFY